MEASQAPPPPPPPAAPPVQPPPPQRVDVGRVISQMFSLYGAHIVPLLATAAVVFIVAGAVQELLARGSLVLVLLGSVVNLAATALYTGFVVKLVQDVRDGKRDFSIGELLGAATPVIFPLIANGILKGIAVVIGFILIIVPGLILLTIWAVTAPAIVVERRGIIEAFGRSRELVRGDGWSVFGVIVIAFLIALVIGFIFGAIGTAIGEAGNVILGTIGAIIAAPISALVSSILFFDLGGGSSAPSAPQDAGPTTAPEPPTA